MLVIDTIGLALMRLSITINNSVEVGVIVEKGYFTLFMLTYRSKNVRQGTKLFLWYLALYFENLLCLLKKMFDILGNALIHLFAELDKKIKTTFMLLNMGLAT